MKIKKLVLNIKNWVKDNPVEFWVLLAILVIGAFCRFYKIDQYMTFLGDEGRDVIIVRKIFTELHPPLIGPGTSIGNMYLGPLYYYMMAIPLLIAGYSPIGPAVMIALLGIITIAFVWWVGRTWFDKKVGLIAAGLYAISPIVIIYSRSSWNPNIMPFFALLSIYAIWKVWKTKEFNWLIVMGISFAFALQSHYLALLLIPTLFIYWLATIIEVRKSKLKIPFIKKSILGLISFLVLMSPLFFFDMRHGWMNTKAIYTFFTVRQTTVSIRPWTAIPKIPLMLDIVAKSVVAGRNSIAGIISSIVIGVSVLYIFIDNFIKRKNLKLKGEYWMVLSWLGFGLIGFGLYKQNIYDHYFGFLFAAPFLLLGIIISVLWSKKIVFKLIGSAVLIYLIIINLLASPLLKEPNKLLQRSIHVSKVIEENSAGNPFNLAVIADTNYEDAYKYFLLVDKYPVVDIDAQKPETTTDQLFVVCELIPNSKCDPTHSPKAQVASFGWSKIDNGWEVDGAIVYKLVHSR